jgi:hypothetical protein
MLYKVVFKTVFNTASSAALDSPVSEDVGIEPRIVATLALSVRCSDVPPLG